jgi:hypothetical protein
MRRLRPPHHRGRSSSGPNATAWPICFWPACQGTRPGPSRRDADRTRLRTGMCPAGCAPEGLTEAHQAAPPAIQQALQPPFQACSSARFCSRPIPTRSRDRNDGRSEYWSGPNGAIIRDGGCLQGWHSAVRWAAHYRTGKCRRDRGRHGRLWQARAPAGRLRQGPTVLRPTSRQLRSSWPAVAGGSITARSPGGQLIADTRTLSAEMPA